MNESEKQFSFTRAALSTSGRANNQIPISYMNTHKHVSAAALLLAFSIAACAQNLITDPSFELGSTNWSFVGYAGRTGPGHTGGAGAYLNAPIANTTGSVSQTINTIAGQTYRGCCESLCNPHKNSRIRLKLREMTLSLAS
jgi:hypothetical protein